MNSTPLVFRCKCNIVSARHPLHTRTRIDHLAPHGLNEWAGFVGHDSGLPEERDCFAHWG